MAKPKLPMGNVTAEWIAAGRPAGCMKPSDFVRRCKQRGIPAPTSSSDPTDSSHPTVRFFPTFDKIEGNCGYASTPEVALYYKELLAKGPKRNSKAALRQKMELKMDQMRPVEDDSKRIEVKSYPIEWPTAELLKLEQKIEAEKAAMAFARAPIPHPAGLPDPQPPNAVAQLLESLARGVTRWAESAGPQGGPNPTPVALIDQSLKDAWQRLSEYGDVIDQLNSISNGFANVVKNLREDHERLKFVVNDFAVQTDNRLDKIRGFPVKKFEKLADDVGTLSKAFEDRFEIFGKRFLTMNEAIAKNAAQIQEFDRRMGQVFKSLSERSEAARQEARDALEICRRSEAFVAEFGGYKNILVSYADRETVLLNSMQALEVKVKELQEAAIEGGGLPPTHFRLVPWAGSNGIYLEAGDSSRIAKLLIEECKSRGLEVRNVPSETYGKINIYPLEVLQWWLAQTEKNRRPSG